MSECRKESESQPAVPVQILSLVSFRFLLSRGQHRRWKEGMEGESERGRESDERGDTKERKGGRENFRNGMKEGRERGRVMRGENRRGKEGRKEKNVGNDEMKEGSEGK